MLPGNQEGSAKESIERMESYLIRPLKKLIP